MPSDIAAYSIFDTVGDMVRWSPRSARPRSLSSTMIGGHQSPGTRRYFVPISSPRRVLPKLKARLIIDGAGHWIQQERPNEVNAALVSFLNENVV